MIRPSYAFASDNAAPTHPRIMQAMVDANKDYQIPYDNSDEYGLRARAVFAKILGADAQVFFVLNGSGANVVSLLSTLNSYQSVLCASDAHINTDECGSSERIVGCKLVVVPSTHAKIQIEQLDPFLGHQGDLHRAQVRVLSITQATELGTLYSSAEIKALCNWAHQNNILVHVDGARIANAVVALGSDFKKITFDLGVDIISFGATKNGLAFGDAVIFKNADLAKHTPFSRKQSTQLLSKSRYISAQFIPYLEEGIWQSNAKHANYCAETISKSLLEMGIVPVYPVQANEIFIELSGNQLKRIQESFCIYPWTTLPNDKIIARIVTSWANTEQEVQMFLACIQSVL